jgi:hypothetical protein
MERRIIEKSASASIPSGGRIAAPLQNETAAHSHGRRCSYEVSLNKRLYLYYRHFPAQLKHALISKRPIQKEKRRF